MNRKPLHAAIIALSFLYGIGMVVLNGMIPERGRWYSPSPAFRQQVDALLRGRLALSDSPLQLENDLIWSNNGVHQAWGLGVPLWRLPFEAAARTLGAAQFPDMCAVALALGLFSWLVLRTSWRDEAPNGPPLPAGVMAPALAGTPLIVLFFPAFIGLLRSRFQVYEEVVAYGYLFSMALLMLVMRLQASRSRRAYYGMCLLAGMAAWIRPTLAVYGLSSVLCGWFALRPHAAPPGDGSPPERTGAAGMRVLFLGSGFFAVTTLLLLVANMVRFGHALEFGHHLTINAISPVLYASRFDDPYAGVPIADAAKELFGFLFRVTSYNGPYYYQPDIFPGQSPGIRFREAYLTTFDLTYLLLIAAGMAVGAAAFLRTPGSGARGAGADRPATKGTAVVALWSVLPLAALTVFYLYGPAIASRHVLDYLPAFAALTVVLWRGCAAWCLRSRRAGTLLWMSLLLLGAWTAVQVSQVDCYDGMPQAATRDEVQRPERAGNGDREIGFPPAYDAGSLPDGDILGIPYNGSGWMERTGLVKPVVVLFVQDPLYLEVEVAGNASVITDGDLKDVRAKIGLEFLAVQSTRRTPRGAALRFHVPRQERYRRGIQTVFLGFGRPTGIVNDVPTWRLFRVQWRDEPPPGA